MYVLCTSMYIFRERAYIKLFFLRFPPKQAIPANGRSKFANKQNYKTQKKKKRKKL